MTDVTMIGLGAMGGALADALMRAGYSITVWNRTPDKALPFADMGAHRAESISGAFEASPVIVMCVDNYDVSKDLIGRKSAKEDLSGKTLIQLSTGTPKDAAEFSSRILACGGQYIDGAIMAFPENIGSEEAMFLIAGEEDTYEQCKPILACLGGDLRYLGSETTATAVIDLAYLTQEMSTYLGAIHGALLCESENVGIDIFASVLPDGHPAKDLMRVIHANKFDDPEATLVVWNGALQRIQMQAHDTGINSDIPDFVSALFKRAISAGYGEENIAALIKVLRRDSPKYNPELTPSG
jgi:3-hydroxyisobutyrate dehydrogenase-like beta-hydroxyacid dehydrogenase